MPTKDEIQRMPWRVNQQGSGCCGFAGSLMALYDRAAHAPSQLQYKGIRTALEACLEKSQKFKDILKTDKITERIKKRFQIARESYDISQFDLQLCITLMIILKEYLRQINNNKIWDDCITFSSNFGATYISKGIKGQDGYIFKGNSYDKLKDIPKKTWFGSARSPEQLMDGVFHYKAGDLALTPEAVTIVCTLLGMEPVKITMRSGVSLSDLTDVNVIKETAIPESLLNTTSLKSCLLGLESLPSSKPRLRHWVYVPLQSSPNTTQKITHTQDSYTWTWGDQFTLAKLKAAPNNLVPCVLIELPWN